MKTLLLSLIGYGLPSGEGVLPVAIPIAGGFVGFWGGLALDSLDCPFDPAEDEREPE